MLKRKLPYDIQKIQLEVGVKAFIQKDEEYLFLKRAKSYPGDMALKWDIPGGRINPGEPFEKGLAREIKEETGLTFISIDKILAVQDIIRVKDKHTVRITFLAKCKGIVKINPAEHTDFRWLTLDEIKKMQHDTYLSPVIKILEKFYC